MLTSTKPRRLVTILAMVLVIAVLAGCSGGKSDAPPTNGEKQQEYKLNVATATTGGVYYPMGNALAQIWSKNIPGVKAAAQSTAGTPQNIELMQNKEADIAFGQNGIAYYAYNGTGTYEGKAVTSIRGMLALYPNVMHMVVRKGAGINSVADLNGKRFVPGQVASATEINGREILSVYGLNYMKDKGETNVSADFVGYNEAVDLLKDGHTDAILIAGGIPTASVMDILASGQADLIPLEDDKIAKISEEFPWYFEITVPAGTYPNQDKDIKTVAVSNMLIVREDLPEDLVYDLTKVVYDYHDDLVAGHQAAKDTTLDTALDGMIIPLHPGSIKYFKEQGLNLDNVPTE
ncbi:MAG: TAXI family TRAP transporter solute-binding subunit [bacterium]|jgi:TRAP transporter TAXI family solute receptor